MCHLVETCKYYRNSGEGGITSSCRVSSGYNQLVHEDVPLRDSWVSFRRLLQQGGHRNASFSFCCWLFLALPISSFSPFLRILLLSKSFLPLGPVIIFRLFQMLIQNNYIVDGLTLVRRKGKRGKLFWCRIGNFVVY